MPCKKWKVFNNWNMKKEKRKTGARLRIVLGPDMSIGPGKAAILEEVKATGSIAAAGRSMGMAYKRAWYMVDTMNKSFKEPLIITVKGGKSGGGSCLSELGEEVLKRYRKMEASSANAIASDLASLKRKLKIN